MDSSEDEYGPMPAAAPCAAGERDAVQEFVERESRQREQAEVGVSTVAYAAHAAGANEHGERTSRLDAPPAKRGPRKIVDSRRDLALSWISTVECAHAACGTCRRRRGATYVVRDARSAPRAHGKGRGIWCVRAGRRAPRARAGRRARCSDPRADRFGTCAECADAVGARTQFAGAVSSQAPRGATRKELVRSWGACWRRAPRRRAQSIRPRASFATPHAPPFASRASLSQTSFRPRAGAAPHTPPRVERAPPRAQAPRPARAVAAAAKDACTA